MNPLALGRSCDLDGWGVVWPMRAPEFLDRIFFVGLYVFRRGMRTVRYFPGNRL